MKNARMNISHSRFILFKLKIFGEIVTTYSLLASIDLLSLKKLWNHGNKNLVSYLAA